MIPDPAQNRRAPVRIDAEDGPWSVSVAESPHDVRSYSLYIKTPTHNLTLTRTAVEIVELDSKLRESLPGIRIPTLPLDAKAISAKRKSNFLNTLSRLASPHSNKTRRSNNASVSMPSNKELSDSLQSFTATAITATLPTTANSTSLAAYLTTVSNTAAFRQARIWQRFVRVRTDDLESVRVERAIKRVRSDLAAHTGMSAKPEPAPQVPPKDNNTEQVEKPSEEQTVETLLETPAPTEQETISEVVMNRLHRSRSADPESSARLSRVFTSSSLNQDGASFQTDRETGDESSTSEFKKPKKKRSMSVDPKKKSRKVVIDDFEMTRVLGKGCAGKVLLVKHKSTADLYALKAITKRHVLAHQELQHTLTEQSVLKRMAAESKDPFVVKLWWSFHDKENLFLVMDFHPGGDLATQLARWGRLGRDRARFYAAEIVEGVEGLHAAGVIYRDLKPENILIGGDGHIVLTDFGLSKEFPRRLSAPPTPTGSHGELTPPWMQAENGGEMTAGWPGQPVGQSDSTSTFCGTAEYLAPEVIQGLPYSYQVDWWSFGTMLFEMLTGITPFWAATHADMYVRVLQDELHFPDDRAIDQDTKSLLRGLLQRNPALRITEPRIKRHPYFSMIDWAHVYYKRYIPPYIPPTDPSNASDTQNFDETFLDMEPVLDEYTEENEETDTDQDNVHTDTDRTDNTTPSQSQSSSAAGRHAQPGLDEESVDVFDGYSFKGRQSVLIEDEDDESSEEETDEEIQEAPAPDMEPDTPTQETEKVYVGEPKTTVNEVLPPLPESPELESSELPAVPPEDTKPRKSQDLSVDGKAANRLSRPARREKSGVHALDRYLSDEGEHDDEDDEWDIVEAGDGEDRNGAKGTTLFARGVVDRYRLAVFRKVSTPTPTQRKGRFRTHPRQFLKTQSPPPSAYSSKPSLQRSMSEASSSLLTTSPNSLLTPSPSSLLTTSPSSLLTPSPSLKSKPSSMSVSDQSDSLSPTKEKKNKKLRKYKENAEKVLSLFSPTPRMMSHS